MTDSSVPDKLDANHERNQQRRIEGIKRWVEYIRSELPEEWGLRQNAVVNDQLEVTQNVGTRAEH